MDRFTELETFLAVADAGGFNAGARALGKSPPTVTRLVAGLEDRIGTRLFIRTTRQIALTEAGQRLRADAKRILDELAAAEASAAGAHQDPQGVLRITAPVIFGRLYIAPVLRSFLDLHPQVTVRALFVDRIVNLIDEGLDVAVRLGDLPDSSMTATRVGTVRRVTVAAPDYLAAHGRPARLEDLSRHRLVDPGMVARVQIWDFVAGRERHTVEIAPALVANTIDTAIDAALAGWAITRVMSYQVSDALASGALVEVLPEFEDRVIPVHLVHAEGALRAAKIRAFLDHATRELRTQAARWLTSDVG